jgi:hypothetical protein
LIQINTPGVPDIQSICARQTARKANLIGGCGMSADQNNRTIESENPPREKPELSRRGFLASLVMLGIGGAAAIVTTASDSQAATATDMANGAKAAANKAPVPEAAEAQVAQKVDPDDPLTHFNQPYYRHRRRVARRVVRRNYRYGRRVHRRVRRRAIVY